MKIFLFLFILIKPFIAEDDKLPEFFKSRCAKNCTFEPYYLETESIKAFPKNCSKVCAYLLIDQNSGVTENQLIEIFKNMKTLYGSLEVKSTQITSGKFLEGLEVIECDPGSQVMFWNNDFMVTLGLINFTSTSCNIALSQQNMTHLDLPKLKNFYTVSPEDPLPRLSIGGKQDEFCVSIQETNNFVISDFLNIEIIFGSFCPYLAPTIDDEKICSIENFSLQNFDPSCKRIIGNVVIQSGDEGYVGKLKNVTWIYGTLLIEGTSLESIDFFDSLEYMAGFLLGDQFIGIFDNGKLRNVTFPKLKRVRSDQKFLMLFNRNTPQLFNPEFCWRMKKNLNSSEWHAPSIDGKNCEEIQEMYKFSNGIQLFLVFSFSVVFLNY